MALLGKVPYKNHGLRHGRGGSDPLPLFGDGGSYHFKLFRDDTAVTTGDGAFIWVVPPELNGLNLDDVILYVTTVSSSGKPTLQLANLTTGHDLLSTKVSVDVGEYDSTTAAVPPVIDNTYKVVSTSDRISFDVDIGGTGAQGMGVVLTFESDAGGYGAKGEPGDQGPPGADGLGVPAGGTTGQVLTKDSNADNDTSWQTPSASGYTPGGTDVALADGGTGASLVDPNADRIMFWDDSAGSVDWLTAGTGLSIAGTTISATGGGGVATDTIFDAKGDLPVGTGADTAAKQTVGSNDTVLTADSAQTTGVKWVKVGEAMLALTDVTTADVSSSAHGFAPKSPADATKFLNGAATPAYALVKDSDLSTSDITTNDVSTSKHGFTPKAPNDTSKFLRGDGTWAAPGGGGGGSSSVATDVIWDAKGDLAAGTGADAASRVAIGSNGQVLVADSAQTPGMKWSYPEIQQEMTYVEQTTSVTITATGTPHTTLITAGAFTADGTSAYMIEFWCEGIAPSASAGRSVSVFWYLDGSVFNFLAQIVAQGTSAQNYPPVYCKLRHVPSSGSRTYSVRAVQSGGNGTMNAGTAGSGSGAYAPAWIRVVRIG